MERSIQEVAKAAGTTSRTLRHYDSVGLVSPSRIGHNGYRYYDDRALVRLQRVLLLRDLGLGLDAIGQVLAVQDAQADAPAGGRALGNATSGSNIPGSNIPGSMRHDGRARSGARASDADPARAEARILRSHMELLEQESRRIAAQIGAVGRTIAALESSAADPDAGDEGKTEKRGDLMSQNMFDGFDHTQYKDEVEARWGKDAYAKGDAWWRSLGEDGQAEWQERLGALNRDWIAAAERGEGPASEAAQDLARRHVEWLQGVPHTPAQGPGGDLAGYVLGLTEMYVADERFAANYGGFEGATFVRDALKTYVERELRD